MASLDSHAQLRICIVAGYFSTKWEEKKRSHLCETSHNNCFGWHFIKPLELGRFKMTHIHLL